MNKLRSIFETTREISFISPQQEFSLYWNSYLESELGQIYRAIPWDQLARSLKLKENRSGRKSLFSPQGKLALMLLKAYSGMSVRRVYEQLTGISSGRCFVGSFLGRRSYLTLRLSAVSVQNLAEGLIYGRFRKYWLNPENPIWNKLTLYWRMPPATSPTCASQQT